MVRARYIGEAEGDVSAFGTTFADGKYAEVGPQFLTKLLGNPHFEVEGARNGASEAKSEPEAPPAPPAAPAPDFAYEAKHRGRGNYSIMRGDEEVREGLTKADAETFNGLSDDDKAAYVADEG